jgi:ascorbate-specific PTS system EIIC-type component UlaA
MKKLLVVLLLVFPVLVLAQETAPDVDIFEALETLTNYLFTLALIVAVIFLIIFPFSMLTAQGDPDKVRTARNYILYALIGVAVAVAAKGLVALVQTIMGV